MRTLGSLFNISSGAVVKRKQAPPKVNGMDYKILTLKSIQENGLIDLELLDDFISVEEFDNKHLTKYGDVIVRLSAPFTAVAINKEIEDILVPSLFAILRPKSNNIISEYASLYLNSDIMRKQYSKDSSGSAIQMIKTSSIREFSIEVLEIERQKKAIELNKLIVTESRLLQELIERKRVYNRMIINAILTGGLDNGNQEIHSRRSQQHTVESL